MTTSGTDCSAPGLAALPAGTGLAGPGAGGGAAGTAPAARPRRRVFPGHPEQVAHARRFVRRALAPHGPAADAALLASELATNAIQHTASGQGGTFEVVIWRSPATVRVAVIDGGAPSLPATAPPGSLSASGRGLALVNALARQWGQHGNHHRRTVWFELDAQ
jgi:serine/threonine-protein kinase RsbW